MNLYQVMQHLVSKLAPNSDTFRWQVCILLRCSGWFGVMVTALVKLTELSYVEPG